MGDVKIKSNPNEPNSNIIKSQTKIRSGNRTHHKTQSSSYIDQKPHNYYKEYETKVDHKKSKQDIDANKSDKRDEENFNYFNYDPMTYENSLSPTTQAGFNSSQIFSDASVTNERHSSEEKFNNFTKKETTQETKSKKT